MVLGAPGIAFQKKGPPLRHRSTAMTFWVKAQHLSGKSSMVQVNDVNGTVGDFKETLKAALCDLVFA